MIWSTNSCILVSLLLATGCMCDVVILKGPENQAVEVNDTVVFHCSVVQHESLTNYIFWDECITGSSTGSCRRISNDRDLVYNKLGGDTDREARYSVATPEKGVYNLVITGVSLEDAGKYTCTASNADKLYWEADLIVLEPPECTSNITDDELNIGDDVMMTCQVVHAGRAPPVLTWWVNGDVFKGQVTHQSFMRYVTDTILLSVMAVNDGHEFTMVTTFPAPHPCGDTSRRAMNKPDYNHTTIFPILRVEKPDRLTAFAVGPEGSQNIVGCLIPAAGVSLALTTTIMILSVALNFVILFYLRGQSFGGLDTVLEKLTAVKRVPARSQQYPNTTTQETYNADYNSTTTENEQTMDAVQDDIDPAHEDNAI